MVVLSRVSPSDFLDLDSDIRAAYFGPLIGEERIVRSPSAAPCDPILRVDTLNFYADFRQSRIPTKDSYSIRLVQFANAESARD